MTVKMELTVGSSLISFRAVVITHFQNPILIPIAKPNKLGVATKIFFPTTLKISP
jgi:hypothetical protein